MHGMPLYETMSDDDVSDERFSDENGARTGQPKSSHRSRSFDGGISGEDSDARRKRKSKRKSKRPSSSDNMTEEELMAASARRKRESKKASSALVIPPGAPEGRISSHESSEDPKESRYSSRQSGSRSRQSAKIDEAISVSDEEDPFARSRAPPNESSRSAPSPSANTKKQEINPDFKDVRETGRWGSISKKEMWIVGIVGLLVIIGVIVAVVVVITTGGNDSAPAPANLATSPPVPTAAPTARVVLTPQEQLSIINAATIDNPATEGSLALLGQDVSFFQGKTNDPTADPVVRAASWIMYDDPIDNEEWLIPRYGLAVLFYATNGAGWTNSTGWLTEVNACEWIGIRCDRFNKAIEEIDLSGNQLVGTIPNEVSMVDSLISLWLRKNEISGTIPNVALGNIPLLSILYLDGNNLNGTVTPDLAASGSLSKLHLCSTCNEGKCLLTFAPLLLIFFIRNALYSGERPDWDTSD
jgi:hypothetical protein